MNKLLILAALIPVLLLTTPQALADPNCYSHSGCYNIGYGHGYGQNGYSAVDACRNHSQAYYDGNNQGYRNAVSDNSNTRFQQDESSQVGIHGNNNDVNINQAENTQTGSDDGKLLSGSYIIM